MLCLYYVSSMKLWHLLQGNNALFHLLLRVSFHYLIWTCHITSYLNSSLCGSYYIVSDPLGFLKRLTEQFREGKKASKSCHYSFLKWPKKLLWNSTSTIYLLQIPEYSRVPQHSCGAAGWTVLSCWHWLANLKMYNICYRHISAEHHSFA